jgi:hypothetical protein
VGKGRDDRAFSKSGRNRYWNNIVNKYGYSVEIVADGLQEWYAFELECELITLYGRINLCNLTDGGDGTSGRIVGENEKRLKREALKGKPLMMETRQKISISAKGRVLSESTKQKLSIAGKGRIMSIETRQKMSANNAMKNNPEARMKVSAAKKGKPNPKIAGDLNHMKKPEYRHTFAERLKLMDKVWLQGKNNPSARRVKCVQNDLVFETMLDAAHWLVKNGKTTSLRSGSNICSVCTGKLKSAYGFTWVYA